MYGFVLSKRVQGIRMCTEQTFRRWCQYENNVQGLCKIKKEKECKARGPPCFHDTDDVVLVRVEVHEAFAVGSVA